MPYVSAAAYLLELQHRSGLNKHRFCRQAQLSRTLFDAYLSGEKHPTVTQLNRISQAFGYQTTIGIMPAERYYLNAEKLVRVTAAASMLPTRPPAAAIGFPKFKNFQK